MTSKPVASRVAGILYLILAITGFFSRFVSDKLIVLGNAETTAQKVLSSMVLFRFGLLSSVLMILSWTMLALVLYRQFRSFHTYMATLMVSCVLIGGAVCCLTILGKFSGLLVLYGPGYLASLAEGQLQSLAMLSFDCSNTAFHVAKVFFGVWLLPLGFLIHKSGYFPKILVVLLFVAALGYIGDFLVFTFFPGMNANITGFTFWGEVTLMLWLLIFGVRNHDQTRDLIA